MQTENKYLETDLGNVSLNPRGEYDADVSYEYLDLVSLDGGSYVCIAEFGTTVAGLSPVPGESTETWQCIAVPGGATEEFKDMVNLSRQYAERSRQNASTALEAKLAASQSAVNAAESEGNAKESENNASDYMDSASGYAKKASEAKEAAVNAQKAVDEAAAKFPVEVEAAIAEAREQVSEAKQTALEAVIHQQNTSVDAVKRQTQEFINTQKEDAKQEVRDIVDSFDADVEAIKNDLRGTGNEQVARVETRGNEKVAEITSAGDTEIAAVDEAGKVQIQAVSKAGESQLGAIAEAGQTNTEAVNSAKENALVDIGSAVTGGTQQIAEKTVEQINSVTAAGTAQKEAVENCGTETVASVSGEGAKQISAVELAGSGEVKKVNDAGTAQKTAVENAGAKQTESVNNAGNVQIKAVTAEGTKQKNEIMSAGSTQKTEIGEAGASQKTAIADEGRKQVSSVSDAGTAQVASVNSAGGKQVEAVAVEGAKQVAAVQKILPDLEDDIANLDKRISQTEMGSAACIGIRRMCMEDGTPQSATTWERWGQYTDAVVKFAAGMDAVQNDLMDKWPYSKLRPCNLPLDKDNPVAYLGDADFDWYANKGVAAGTSVMLEVPTEMYLAHWYETDSSGQKWEYKCVADTGRYPNSVYVKDLMVRADGSRTKYFYFPIFLGTVTAEGKYISAAGQLPTVNTSCTSYRSKVKANGDNWQLIDVWAWEVISDLAEIMSANANFRTTYGKGCSSFGGSSDMTSLKAAESTNVIAIAKKHESKLRVGMTVTVGASMWNGTVCQNREITGIVDSESISDAIEVTLDGEPFNVLEGSVLWRCAQKTGATVEMASPNGSAGANDGLHSNRVLYIEDFYGMLHTGVDGMNLKFNEEKMGLEMWVCNNPAKYSDTYDGYKCLPEVLSLNRDQPSNYELSGYIKQEHFFSDYPLLEMPKVVSNGAGSESYIAAYCWKNKNGQRPFFGGAFYGGVLVSPRSRSCALGFSGAHWNYGSRPLRR